jgi:hypothetical protein
MELTLNVNSVSTYIQSLGIIISQVNCGKFDNKGPYFKDHQGAYMLCRHSQKFEELFGNRETIVNIKWGGETKLGVILNSNSLYVVKISNINGEALWNSSLEQAYTDVINDKQNNNSNDCFVAHDEIANGVDLNFWQVVKGTFKEQDGNLSSTFKDLVMLERVFVYVAEAIRFPSLFIRQFDRFNNNEGTGSFFPIKELWKSYFRNWDTLSKATMAELIKGINNADSVQRIKGGGPNQTDKNQIAKTMVKGSNLVRTNKIDDVASEVAKLLPI